jgi:mRNA interferase RelE/StbE
MVYQVLLTREAEKDLAKLPEQKRTQVFRALDGLTTDPFLGKALKGELKGVYSLRVWPFRILYRIEKKKLIILVLSIPHRKNAYR